MTMINRKNVIKISMTLGIIGVITAVFVHFYGLPALTKFIVLKATLLTEGTTRWEKWVTIPFPLHFKVYIFNVTNPGEVEQGAKPVLAEMGPYVYDQYLKKHNVTVEGDTISYNMERILKFNQAESGPERTEDDIITTINLAFLGTALHLESKMPMALSILSDAAPKMFPENEVLFRTSTVKQFLFEGVPINCSLSNGPAVMICNGLKAIKPATIRLAENSSDMLFSFLHHKNATLSRRYNVSSGLENFKNIGQILSYDDKDSNSVWLSEDCNKIHGTDTNIFHSLVSRDEHLFVYDPDMCRTMFIEFERDTEVKSLPAYKFVLPVENVADFKTVAENKCYCSQGKDPQKPRCFKKGVFNPAPCTNQPTVISFPHFYGGDCEYISFVEGLSPQKELHETFVNIEPVTGIPLNGAKRIQFNMPFGPITKISALGNTTRGIFPVLWIDDGADPNDIVLTPLHALQFALNWFRLVNWALLVVSVVCVLLVPAALAVEERAWSGQLRPFVRPLAAPPSGRPDTGEAQPRAPPLKFAVNRGRRDPSIDAIFGELVTVDPVAWRTVR
nr:PREDICTED: sensory neuron membrane protein 2-like [Bemisia tabaci]